MVDQIDTPDPDPPAIEWRARLTWPKVEDPTVRAVLAGAAMLLAGIVAVAVAGAFTTDAAPLAPEVVSDVPLVPPFGNDPEPREPAERSEPANPVEPSEPAGTSPADANPSEPSEPPEPQWEPPPTPLPTPTLPPGDIAAAEDLASTSPAVADAYTADPAATVEWFRALGAGICVSLAGLDQQPPTRDTVTAHAAAIWAADPAHQATWPNQARWPEAFGHLAFFGGCGSSVLNAPAA